MAVTGDKAMIDVRHIDEIDMAAWFWPHFKPWELCSPDDKSLKMSERVLDALEDMRAALSAPIHITSAYRTRS